MKFILIFSLAFLTQLSCFAVTTGEGGQTEGDAVIDFEMLSNGINPPPQGQGSENCKTVSNMLLKIEQSRKKILAIEAKFKGKAKKALQKLSQSETLNRAYYGANCKLKK